MGKICGKMDSPAARDLIARAMAHSHENLLYVVSIGAPTNVASAITMAPEIAQRIVVVWLGGNVLDWPSCREFNLSQDLAGSKVLFSDEVSLVQVPCMGMASAFSVTAGELKQYFLGKNPLCDYLARTVLDDMNDSNGERLWSRILWDVTACAWLMGEHLMLDRLEEKPMPTESVYLREPGRVKMRYVYHIHRDALVADMVAKLTK